MLSHDENALLTRVGRGTPVGELLRRYWWPIGFSTDLGAKPKQVRLLGEDLVLFKLPTTGTLGLLALHCAHRGAGLQYGRIEAEGIRCCYHGWCFAPDGRCLDQPVESPESTFKDRVRQPAFAAQELGGLVFGYLGPEPAPLLPRYDVLVQEGGTRTLRSFPNYNNWLQGVENAADMSHIFWLHASQYPDFATKRPTIAWEQTDYGMRFTIDGIPEISEANVGSLIFPAHNRFASRRVGQEASHMLIFRVPIDDTRMDKFSVTFYSEASRETNVRTIGYDERLPGVYATSVDDWWGIASEDQDRMAQESQGVIVDRSSEHLAESDRGVTMYRSLLRAALADVQQGRDPVGIRRFPEDDRTISFDAHFHLVEALRPA